MKATNFHESFNRDPLRESNIFLDSSTFAFSMDLSPSSSTQGRILEVWYDEDESARWLFDPFWFSRFAFIFELKFQVPRIGLQLWSLLNHKRGFLSALQISLRPEMLNDENGGFFAVSDSDSYGNCQSRVQVSSSADSDEIVLSSFKDFNSDCSMRVSAISGALKGMDVASTLSTTSLYSKSKKKVTKTLFDELHIASFDDLPMDQASAGVSRAQGLLILFRFHHPRQISTSPSSIHICRNHCADWWIWHERQCDLWLFRSAFGLFAHQFEIVSIQSNALGFSLRRLKPVKC